jgi:hypothetical protein
LTAAQAPAGGTAQPQRRPASAKPSADHTDPDFAAEAERATAVALVVSLANEARNYRNPTVRARVLTRAADALWESNREQARAIFYRAWEAAEAVDKEGLERVEEARKAFLSGQRRGSGMIPPAPNLRGEVLRLASQRSRELGEEFLGKLNDAKEQEEADAASPVISDPTEPPYAIARRLELARQLLETGEIERAMLFAGPALKYTTSQGVIFLSLLRQRKSTLADELYAALLNQAAGDPFADATTVSLLSSYLFSPSLLVTATRNGRLSNQLADALPPPVVSPSLRASFFRVATQILLRPLPPPGQDRGSAGRGGTYFTVARLLPLFEQYTPDQVPALRALLSTLTPDVPAQYLADNEGMLTLGLTPANTPANELQDPLSQINGSSTVAERNAAYAKAARAAALKGDPHAREYAEKIENEYLKRRVLAFVDFALLRDAIGRERVEEAIRLARAGSFEPLQRVWAYTEIARISKRTSPATALEVLGDALLEARRIDETSSERAYALLATATQLIEVDPPRGWEVTAEAVKVANGIDGYTGEEGKVELRFDTNDNITILKADASAFNLANVFARLAKDDFLRASSLAKTLTGEYTRALSTIAVARSVLDKKRSPTTHPALNLKRGGQ